MSQTYREMTETYVKGMWSHTKHKINALLRRPTIEINGITLAIEKHFPSWIYEEDLESDEARCVLAKIQPDDVVMEFGAGLGYLSALCAKRIGSERVFAYEANPELIPLIQKTYSNNGVQPTLTKALLGETNGRRTFFIEGNFLSSSIIQRSEKSRQVEVLTLDINEEIARLRPTFLIIDVEGGEAELVPYIDFSNVHKVVIELHRRVIGDQIDAVRAHFTKQGFTVDPKLSNGTVLYLEKL
jgi:FkbM family methyltransferase